MNIEFKNIDTLIPYARNSRKHSAEQVSNEYWLKIPGLDGYEASSAGRIRSVDRYRNILNRWGCFMQRFHAGRILTLKKKPSGYLYFYSDGKKYVHVHRAVASAFHGDPPTSFHEAAHIDGDKSNNRPENLTWATPKENASHKKSHGTHPSGEKNGASKLKESDVSKIIEIYSKGDKADVIASKFNVSATTIRLIISGKLWGHVKSSFRKKARYMAKENMMTGYLSSSSNNTKKVLNDE